MVNQQRRKSPLIMITMLLIIMMVTPVVQRLTKPPPADARGPGILQTAVGADGYCNSGLPPEL